MKSVGHTMLRALVLIALTVFVTTRSIAQGTNANPFYVDQGLDWTAAARADFYSRDQGSRLIALSRMQALKQRNGQPFLADGLSRLSTESCNSGQPSHRLSRSGPQDCQVVGMTCSACHTLQIEVNGKVYRVDGGPGFVDFYALLRDLDKAVGEVIASDSSFAPFAAAVLRSAVPDAIDVADLRLQVGGWYLRFHTLMHGARAARERLGVCRLDAVGMIFNRVSGLDIGPPPDFMIPENIKTADAPVRYPFLWNAPRQDKTQWPGFAKNGSGIVGLARNVGQVLGG
ncbi:MULTISPECIES: di-heme-cytochrome C peroxidase [Bradyrhizobium]|uniref:Cytochrome c domain-containing protein n=1 Tax=Bradyrhizobium septentrionale TaxID=1404411 RepID=A0A973VWN9_9BRAD|nr:MULTISPECIES: di-heme-cytochrome C peroxidase [Bradyrhizobium]QIG97743.1 hypothetical protein G6P99_39020 [Bradyrhizobium sp. 6(2017)]UGY20193.1 di-heme-cytochrome C peroxidase [Bradyrhizobium septentrionale]UGY29039.1 di-heme-cytochrome C peroxidase [Bradyrhizobium septentrionale]